jgi:hypothetical protein
MNSFAVTLVAVVLACLPSGAVRAEDGSGSFDWVW